MIDFRPSRPTLDEYRYLYESAVWTAGKAISDATLRKAIDNSWYLAELER